MMVDSHSHLNFKVFEKDLDNVLARCFDEDVRMVNVGTKYETSKKAIEIAERYDKGVYASVGLHPVHMVTDVMKIRTDEEEGAFSPKGEDYNANKYRDLCSSSKVIAIGEIGLDFYYKPKTKTRIEVYKNQQTELLLKQMGLAEELGLPVIFHCRKAHELLIDILKKKNVQGVIHCFTGTWQEAKKYLDMGFYIGINGIMYKLDLREVIENTPIERILVETDCPYLTPPQAGAERNEPAFVKYIAKDIARIKNISFEEVSQITAQNAQNLFGI